MKDERSVAVLWASIPAEQIRLRTMLVEAGEIDLTRRPDAGGWSVLEVVRHLLFAEQAHLGRHDDDHRGWSPFGYTPATMREARKLGWPAEPQPPVGDVLAAWQAVHERVERALRQRDDATIEAALRRNLKHLRAHTRAVERALHPRKAT